MTSEARIDLAQHELARESYLSMRRNVVSEPAKFGPVELPELPEGGERLLLSREELLSFIRSGDYEWCLDGHSIVTRLDEESGLFAVDIAPLTEAERKEKEEEQDAQVRKAEVKSEPMGSEMRSNAL